MTDVTNLSAEVLSTGSGGVRVDGIFLEVLNVGAGVNDEQTVLEILTQNGIQVEIGGPTLEVLTQNGNQTEFGIIVIEVLVTRQPPLPPAPATIPVFPTVPAGFPVKWRPSFQTTFRRNSSGREARINNRIVSLYEFELVFEVLRDQTQNSTPYAPNSGFTDYMELCQLFLAEYGQAGLFYYSAPWDNSRANQIIGTGTGSKASFVIYRTFGINGAYLTEPIGGINQIFDIYFNTGSGPVLQPSDTYSAAGNVLTFTNTNIPPNGATITATFSFYYLCRFSEDNLDFEEFLKNIWALRALKFRSVSVIQTSTPIVGPTIGDLLLESGEYLLLETGSKIVLE